MPIQDFKENNSLIRILFRPNEDHLWVGVNLCFKKDPYFSDFTTGDPTATYNNIRAEFNKCYRGTSPCSKVNVRFIKTFDGITKTEGSEVDFARLNDMNEPQDPSYNIFDPNKGPYPEKDLDNVTLPLVVFYIGNGEMLNKAAVHAANVKYRVSFFDRTKRAGYLFLGSQQPGPPVCFLHELGHVLGLSDRYISGVDDGNPSGANPGLYVQQPRRAGVPIAKKYIKSVLQAFNEDDIEYDPQLNLMSSLACRLTKFQLEVIRQRKIEPVYPVPERLLIFLKGNADAKRNAMSQSVPCLLTETQYLPCFPVGQDVMFDLPSGTHRHNTCLSNENSNSSLPDEISMKNGSQLMNGVEVPRGEWDKLMEHWEECDGETLQMLKILGKAIK